MKDFKVGSTNFSGLKEWSNDLHSKGQKLVLQINSALWSGDIEDEYYSKALDKQVLLKSFINPNDDHGILT